MLIPTEAIAIAPAISSVPAISPMPASYSAPAGLSAQRPLSLRESPDPSSRTPESTQHASHWLSPSYTRTYVHTSTQKGRVSIVTPPSVLPEKNQHLPLRCQLWSPECSTRLRQSLYDSSGLRRPPSRTLLHKYASLQQDPLLTSERLICAAPAHPRTISLYGSSVHNNVSELAYESTHRTLSTQLDHTIT